MSSSMRLAYQTLSESSEAIFVLFGNFINPESEDVLIVKDRELVLYTFIKEESRQNERDNGDSDPFSRERMVKFVCKVPFFGSPTAAKVLDDFIFSEYVSGGIRCVPSNNSAGVNVPGNLTAELRDTKKKSNKQSGSKRTRKADNKPSEKMKFPDDKIYQADTIRCKSAVIMAFENGRVVTCAYDAKVNSFVTLSMHILSAVDEKTPRAEDTSCIINESCLAVYSSTNWYMSSERLDGNIRFGTFCKQYVVVLCYDSKVLNVLVLRTQYKRPLDIDVFKSGADLLDINEDEERDVDSQHIVFVSWLQISQYYTINADTRFGISDRSYFVRGLEFMKSNMCILGILVATTPECIATHETFDNTDAIGGMSVICVNIDLHSLTTNIIHRVDSLPLDILYIRALSRELNGFICYTRDLIIWFHLFDLTIYWQLVSPSSLLNPNISSHTSLKSKTYKYLNEIYLDLDLDSYKLICNEYFALLPKNTGNIYLGKLVSNINGLVNICWFNCGFFECYASDWQFISSVNGICQYIFTGKGVELSKINLKIPDEIENFKWNGDNETVNVALQQVQVDIKFEYINLQNEFKMFNEKTNFRYDFKLKNIGIIHEPKNVKLPELWDFELKSDDSVSEHVIRVKCARRRRKKMYILPYEKQLEELEKLDINRGRQQTIVGICNDRHLVIAMEKVPLQLVANIPLSGWRLMSLYKESDRSCFILTDGKRAKLLKLSGDSLNIGECNKLGDVDSIVFGKVGKYFVQITNNEVIFLQEGVDGLMDISVKINVFSFITGISDPREVTVGKRTNRKKTNKSLAHEASDGDAEGSETEAREIKCNKKTSTSQGGKDEDKLKGDKERDEQSEAKDSGKAMVVNAVISGNYIILHYNNGMCLIFEVKCKDAPELVRIGVFYDIKICGVYESTISDLETCLTLLTWTNVFKCIILSTLEVVFVLNSIMEVPEYLYGVEDNKKKKLNNERVNEIRSEEILLVKLIDISSFDVGPTLIIMITGRPLLIYRCYSRDRFKFQLFVHKFITPIPSCLYNDSAGEFKRVKYVPVGVDFVNKPVVCGNDVKYSDLNYITITYPRCIIEDDHLVDVFNTRWNEFRPPVLKLTSICNRLFIHEYEIAHIVDDDAQETETSGEGNTERPENSSITTITSLYNVIINNGNVVRFMLMTASNGNLLLCIPSLLEQESTTYSGELLRTILPTSGENERIESKLSRERASASHLSVSESDEIYCNEYYGKIQTNAENSLSINLNCSSTDTSENLIYEGNFITRVYDFRGLNGTVTAVSSKEYYLVDDVLLPNMEVVMSHLSDKSNKIICGKLVAVALKMKKDMKEQLLHVLDQRIQLQFRHLACENLPAGTTARNKIEVNRQIETLIQTLDMINEANLTKGDHKECRDIVIVLHMGNLKHWFFEFEMEPFEQILSMTFGIIDNLEYLLVGTCTNLGENVEARGFIYILNFYSTCTVKGVIGDDLWDKDMNNTSFECSNSSNEIKRSEFCKRMSVYARRIFSGPITYITSLSSDYDMLFRANFDFKRDLEGLKDVNIEKTNHIKKWALSHFMPNSNHFVHSVGSSIFVHEVTDRQFVRGAFTEIPICVSSACVFNKFIIAGDICRGLSFFMYCHDATSDSRNICKIASTSPRADLSVVACAPLVNQENIGILASDYNGNLILFSNVKDEKNTRDTLYVEAIVRLENKVIQFVRREMDYNKIGKPVCMLGWTRSGGIIKVFMPDSKKFALFKLIQNALESVISVTFGITQQTFSVPLLSSQMKQTQLVWPKYDHILPLDTLLKLPFLSSSKLELVMDKIGAESYINSYDIITLMNSSLFSL